MPSGKTPEDYELSKLRNNYNLWADKVAQMSKEFEKTYKIRLEILTLHLQRIVAYQELPMEEYERAYKDDVDPEDEMGHLMNMACDLLEHRFEDAHKYHSSLETFFNKVRGKILKVQKGGKIVHTMNVDEVDAKAFSESVEKIDELRKKLP